MSTKHKYRMERVHFLNIRRIKHGVEFTVTGRNTRGKDITVTFPLSWHFVSAPLMPRIRTLWKAELKERDEANHKIGQHITENTTYTDE